MIRRREFIGGLSGAAAWPLAVRGQQQTKPIIGWLDRPSGLPRDVFEGFRRGLAEIGLLEGRDLTVEYHTTDGHPERLPGLVADLVLRMVAVIFASTTASVSPGLRARFGVVEVSEPRDRRYHLFEQIGPLAGDRELVTDEASLVQQLKALCGNLRAENGDAGEIAAGTI